MQAPDDSTVCPVCGPGDREPELRDERTGIELVRCAGCGLVFQAEQPTDAELADAYADFYARPGKRFGSVVESAVARFRDSRARMATRLTVAGGRVLDVGCGRGAFLAAMQRRGFRVRGTEFSEAAAANVALAGVEIDVGELAPGMYADASFDLVCIWHVLEHCRRPDRTLRATRDALVPGGALMVAVPNYDSLQARWSKTAWFHLDLPRHLYQFTPATLARLLADAGFRVESLRTGQWEMDPFGILQSALNRAGFRHNALYDALSANPHVRRRVPAPWRVAAWAVLAAGMVLAVPAAAVERALGRAGTIVVVARAESAAD